MIELGRLRAGRTRPHQEVAVRAAHLSMNTIRQRDRHMAVLRIRAVVIPTNVDRTNTRITGTETASRKPLTSIACRHPRLVIRTAHHNIDHLRSNTGAVITRSVVVLPALEL